MEVLFKIVLDYDDDLINDCQLKINGLHFILFPSEELENMYSNIRTFTYTVDANNIECNLVEFLSTHIGIKMNIFNGEIEIKLTRKCDINKFSNCNYLTDNEEYFHDKNLYEMINEDGDYKNMKELIDYIVKEMVNNELSY